MHKSLIGVVQPPLHKHNVSGSGYRLFRKYITKFDRREYGFPNDGYTHLVSIEVEHGINKYMCGVDRIRPAQLGNWVETRLNEFADRIKLDGHLPDR